ncbi:MAG: hypothetical protein LOX98_04545 [Lysobacter sp.]|nr:hypothetical protein [Lysobacter sp.]
MSHFGAVTATGSGACSRTCCAALATHAVTGGAGSVGIPSGGLASGDAGLSGNWSPAVPVGIGIGRVSRSRGRRRRDRPTHGRRRRRLLDAATEAAAGKQFVDLRVELAEHLAQLALVVAKQQRAQRRGDLLVGEGLDEGIGQPGRTHRIRDRRKAEHGRDDLEAAAQLLEHRLETVAQRLGEVLPGQVEVDLALVDQPQRQLAAVADAQRAELVEALPDVLPVAHYMGRLVLAKHPERGLVLVQQLRRVAPIVVMDRGLQCFFDVRIQGGRQSAQQLEREAFDLFEHAHRVGTRSTSRIKRLNGHGSVPRTESDATGRSGRGSEHSGNMGQ